MNAPDLDTAAVVESSPSSPMELRLWRRPATRRKDQVVAIAVAAIVAAGLIALITHGLGGGARFDASSEEAFGRSYQEIVRTIPAGEVEPLELAVEKIIRSYALATGRPPALSDLQRKFDGKTADQIVEQARQLQNPALSQSEREALAR